MDSACRSVAHQRTMNFWSDAWNGNHQQLYVIKQGDDDDDDNATGVTNAFAQSSIPTNILECSLIVFSNVYNALSSASIYFNFYCVLYCLAYLCTCSISDKVSTVIIHRIQFTIFYAFYITSKLFFIAY